MPRMFLAPYKFELSGTKHNKKEILLNCLKKYKRELYSDPKEQIRLKCESINIQKNSGLGEIIYGYIEYGKYGTELPVLDENGNITKKIKENESPMNKYFYLFNFRNSEKGYLILQRIGNVGIRTVLDKVINSYSNQLKIKITPIVLGINELVNKDIIDITFEIPRIPRLIDERLNNIIDRDEVKTTVISLKISGNNSFSFENIRKILYNKLRENVENYDLGNIGYIIDENETIKVTVKVGKSRRTKVS